MNEIEDEEHIRKGTVGFLQVQHTVREKDQGVKKMVYENRVPTADCNVRWRRQVTAPWQGGARSQLEPPVVKL